MTTDHHFQLVDDGTESASLRERKKARTRTALIEVSQRLFEKKGYAQTTLEEICAEVEITPQTLLRYFDSKAALALAPMTSPLEQLKAYLADPDRSVDAIATWRRFVTLEATEASEPTSATTRKYLDNLAGFREWVDRDPVLVAMGAEAERSLRLAVAAALAHDRGAAADDLHSTMVAALLVAGRTAVWDRWLEHGRARDSLVDDQLAVVDYAIASLAPTDDPLSNPT
ncbi:MAG: TetR/AcrR family transcriptional regulator [Actinomycetia bacterium]|nr:TetR/AcrR family transcriptional regulator [Actinomycetes bacterium]